EARVARSCRTTLREIRRLLHDPTLTDTALRQSILALMPSEHGLFPSRAAAIRWKLSEKPRQVRTLLKALVSLPFEGEADAPLIIALARLREFYARRTRGVPDAIDVSFAPRWSPLIGGGDHKRSLHAFEAATLLALRTTLRNGSGCLTASAAHP